MRTIYKSQCEAIGEWGAHELAIFEGKVFRIRQCPNTQMVTILGEMHNVRTEQIRRQLRPLRTPEQKMPRWKQQTNEMMRFKGLPPMYRA